MKLLKCFMGDCQGGFNYIRRLFANLEKKLHFVYRNTFIMKRSTYTISLNAGKKLQLYILKTCCQFCQPRKVTSSTLVL